MRRFDPRSNEREQRIEQASKLTADVQEQIRLLDTILSEGLLEPIRSFRDLKDKQEFSTPLPVKPVPVALPPKPPMPAPSTLPPVVRSGVEQAVYSLTQTVIPTLRSRRRAKERAILRTADDIKRKRYMEELAQWTNQTQKIEAKAVRALADYAKQLTLWDEQRTEFLVKQDTYNQTVDDMRGLYGQGNTEAVEYLIAEDLKRFMILDGTTDIDFMLAYEPTAKILLVDYDLPNKKALPHYKEVKAVRDGPDTLKYVPVSDKWVRATYDSVLYQMTLLLIHRRFATDTAGHIYSIIFNGWVRSVDPTTGLDTHACILSVHVRRDEFMSLDLNRVDPKACFKSLKGVASTALVDLAPVRPIARLNKEDSRFIEAYGVVDSLDAKTNLASMDWQDFENLIREVFEKEFSRIGAEVRITQASRDGGVDAVVFDNDALRGGKIVIQAKRYAHTVGVSAVRDLYGTVQHEGAMKGILVTTASFGSDAYEFAKDKPLTLISGAELLSILERHGHSARINLAEARSLYRSGQGTPQ
jgi:restriction system protein